MFLRPVRWPFICLLPWKQTSGVNVWSHNVGLTPSLMLLGKRSRQLLPFGNENCCTENWTRDTNTITRRPRPGHFHRGDFWTSSKKQSFRNRIFLIRGAFYILVRAFLLLYELVPATARSLCLRTLALWVLTVGKRNFNHTNAQTLIVFSARVN